MKNNSFVIIGLLALTTVVPRVGLGQKKKAKNEPAPPPPVVATDKTKSIADLVKSSKSIPGLFQLYQDTASGGIRMVITESQLNKEFILFSYGENGVADAGLIRGSYRTQAIFTIHRYFDKIEFVQENTGMYFDPNSALSKASNANVSHSIMLSEKIEASDVKGAEKKYLIKCDALFLKETLTQIKPPRLPNTPATAFALGALDKEKTKIVKIKNYPENSDIIVEYVYSQESPLNRGTAGVTDARNVSILIQNSLIRMPENDYKPRFDDARVGFFTTEINDMTSTSPIPYRDFINRWHLKKKNPNEAVSEPVQPIVWWIENTTPVEFRDVIKEGVLKWNTAFEKAGFKNAVVVNIQPDNADWDAGDIRYNVLRWTSSPNPFFGGFGPSFTNPRTGQILGADIMLEFVHFTNRVKYTKLYHLTGSAYQESALPDMNTQQFCSYGEVMQENNLFGAAALAAADASDLEMADLKREAMMELAMHEVGHTMGLNHNMKSSQMLTPDQLYDKEFIKGKALTGSIMDYVIINLTSDHAKQGHYYSTALGPYDEWAIEFGYKPVGSEAELNAILAKSTRPELAFGNDADDMRAAGKAIDPRINTDDNSNDQIRYAIDRLELVNSLTGKIKQKYSTPGKSYQELRQTYFVLNTQYDRSATVISRFIGGVYVDRAVVGQPGATKPYTPVAYADQKRAINALNKYVFAADAFKAAGDLYNYLALQRRGYNFFDGPEDPKIHERVISLQREVLRHLLHQNTLQRIVDSQLYGNTYSLDEFFTDLTNGIFTADQNGDVNTFRQNLQIEYVKMLIGISASKDYVNPAKSMAVYLLKDIKAKQVAMKGNVLTKAHREHLNTLIANALDDVK